MNTPYFSSWARSFFLASAHLVASEELRVCSSVGCSGSAPTANAQDFSEGLRSLVENRLPTFSSHSAAVLFFFLGAGGGSSVGSSFESPSFSLSITLVVLGLGFDSYSSNSLSDVSSVLTGTGFLTSLNPPVGFMTWNTPNVDVYPTIRPSHDRGAIFSDSLVSYS